MGKRISIVTGGLWAAALLLTTHSAVAAVVNADPTTYRALLRRLQPGDTLQLAPGRYPRLPIMGLNGAPDAWVTITGPKSGPPAMIQGLPEYNTVEIANSSYVAIENLRIDSRGIPGAFGISAKDREQNRTHNIRIEGNVLVGQNGGQQTVAISTKTPTWGWIIRNNQIIGAGTGIYLGDPDGSQPFVAGVIEQNLIKDTIGYNMQIKDQASLLSMDGIPLGPTSTIIRHNVFIKNDGPSPDGDRPNLMLGSFPITGPGSMNMYEIYGNYFLHNHREALFQASGRVTLHDNIFVDGPYTYPAVVLRAATEQLKIAYVYNNTVYSTGKGIHFGTRAQIDDAVVGNLVFSLTPISGAIMHQSNNTVDSIENAPKYVRSPSFLSGPKDFYPLAGKCQGPAIDLSNFYTDADYAVDFNGSSKVQAKGAVLFRGAYAGEGTNAGWQLDEGVKPVGASVPNPAATLVWVDPANVEVGTSTSVTFTGTNFTEGSVLAFSGKGITAGKMSVAGSTRITATVAIAPVASTGVQQVAVSTPAGSSNALNFRVTSRRGKR